MSKSSTSASDSESPSNSSSNSSSMDSPKAKNLTQKAKMSSYEQQRVKTIEENRARMNALGLKTMAKSLMGTSQIVKKRVEKKGKKIWSNKDDDDDYNPVEEDDEDGNDEEYEKLSGADKNLANKNQKLIPNKKMSNYEQQRLKTIEENRARMEGLGLKTMATSLMGASQIVKKRDEKKGKRKVGTFDKDDDDYNPVEEDEYADEEDEKLSGADKRSIANKKQKGNNKATKPKKPAGQAPKKMSSKYKLLGEPAYVDDDDAMMQAIAMSLIDSAGFLNLTSQPSKSSDAQAVTSSSSLKNQDAQRQDSMGKRKNKKPFNSRVQMTEDDVILHFFQMDEAGKEGISLRDVQRMAAAHDFSWSDKEMADMIKYFDSDGHGKLSLEDFRNIARRCDILQTKEDSAS